MFLLCCIFSIWTIFLDHIKKVNCTHFLTISISFIAIVYIYPTTPITGNRWIHAFSESIYVKWNANNIFQHLNPGCQFHFLVRWLLHQEPFTKSIWVDGTLTVCAIANLRVIPINKFPHTSHISRAGSSPSEAWVNCVWQKNAFNGEYPVREMWEVWSNLFIGITPRFTLV